MIDEQRPPNGDFAPEDSVRRTRLLVAGLAPSVEGLIALARPAISGIAVLIMIVDPDQPTRAAATTYAILFAYLLYGLVSAAIVRKPIVSKRYQYVAHAIDLTVFGVLMFLTEGPTSPFFLFFTFALLAAALRWRWRGAAVTTGLLVLLLFVVYAGIAFSSPGTGFQSGRLVFTDIYLVLVGGLLSYFSAFAEGAAQRLARVARWHAIDIVDGPDPPIVGPVRQAALGLEARRLVVAWGEDNKPGIQTAYWDGIRCMFGLNRALDISRLIVGQSSPEPIQATDARAPSSGELPRLSSEFVGEFLIEDFVAAPFRNGAYRGWIFGLEPREFGPAQLALAEIVAARIGMTLEHARLQRELSDATLARERNRLARELHDGVLQDLAAANLLLSAIVDRAPSARVQLAEVGQILSEQQQRIRRFVSVNNPKPETGRWNFDEELRALLKSLEASWKCQISLDLRTPGLEVSRALGDEIFLTFAEATANAVQHGGSHRLHLTIDKIGRDLDIRIRDFGRGFQSDRVEGQPWSLRQRVAEMGGSIEIVNSPYGVEVVLRIPLDRPAS